MNICTIKIHGSDHITLQGELIQQWADQTTGKIMARIRLGGEEKQGELIPKLPKNSHLPDNFS